MNFLSLLLLSIFVTACSLNSNTPYKISDDSAGLIYGEDDRKDLYQVTDHRKAAFAQSAGIILHEVWLTPSGNGYTVSSSSIGKDKMDSFGKKVCSDVKFKDQMAVGSCSGFLVASNVIATAGHCVDKKDLAEKRFILNFSVSSAGDADSKNLSVSKDQVYKAVRILDSKFEALKDSSDSYLKDSFGKFLYMDYAFVELDRHVPNAQPVELETISESRLNDPIMLVGHPAGIPLKFADEANLRSENDLKFFADMDAFRGNSGSMVVNLRTWKVLGIYTTTSLIPDWVYNKDGDCMGLQAVNQDFGGDRPEEGIVKMPKIYKATTSEVTGKLGLISEPTTKPNPLPSESTGRHGVISNSGYLTGSTCGFNEYTDMAYLGEGSIVEILSGRKMDSVWYVEVRVVANTETSSIRATVGCTGYFIEGYVKFH